MLHFIKFVSDHFARRFANSAGLTLLVSFTEGVGVLMLLPMLGVLGLNLEGGGLDTFAKWVDSFFKFVGLKPTLVTVLLLFLSITFVHQLLLRLREIVNERFVLDMEAHLRDIVYVAISKVSWMSYTRRRSSDYVHYLTAEVERIGEAANQLLSLSVNVIVAMIYVAMAITISPMMALVVFSCALLLQFLLKGFVAVSEELGEEISERTSDLYSVAVEHQTAMKTSMSYGRQDTNAGYFREEIYKVRDVLVSEIRHDANLEFFYKLGTTLILSAILYTALAILKIPTAALLFLILLFSRTMPLFAEAFEDYHECIRALAAFDRTQDLMKECEENLEIPVDREEQIPFEQKLCFESVSFSYNRQEEGHVLEDLSMSVSSGEAVAIVGPSGMGKSTLLDMALGLLVPSKGQVTIDGKELTPERIRSWRSQIGYMEQDVFLFHDTIRANLAWARPDATDPEIWEALRNAAAEDFVSKLPDGLNTMVGDRGVLLSGGERQRLSLARALLRNPKLLILDEPTSALDLNNEQKILESLKNIRGTLTIFIATHRLTILQEVDKIYVLNRGNVVEAGSWEQLNSKGVFKHYELS